MYRVLFLPAIQVVIPGDFIWLLEQKNTCRTHKIRHNRCSRGAIRKHTASSVKLANHNPIIQNAKDMSKGVEGIPTIVYAS